MRYLPLPILTFLYISGLMAAMLLAIAPAAQAELNLPDVVQACLPMASRMLPDHKKEPCHCPPEKMCGTGDLPPGIETLCCEPTQDCTVNRIFNTGTGCPHELSTGPEPVKVCLQYATVPSGDADEDARRGAAAAALNQCLSDCAPLLDEIKDGKEKFSAGAGFFWSGLNMPPFTDSHTPFGKFLQCEFDCRKQAADALDIPLNSSEDSLLDDVEFQQVDPEDIFKDYAISSVSSFSGYNRYVEFIKGASGGKWKMTAELREQYVEEFLENNPPRNIPPGAGLEGKLECERDDRFTVCYSTLLNDSSCSSCLSPNAPVLMRDGSEKAISTIAAGDTVRGPGDAVYTVKEVVILDWPALTLYAINGSLHLTADHPVMTTDGWKAIDYSNDPEGAVKKYGLKNVPKLMVGDTLVTPEGNILVESITALETRTDAKTYNLRLEGGDRFFANGVLVRSNKSLVTRNEGDLK